ncbi:MAG: FprA family A-type flavoprotein, partial [Actinomycetota bacterium]|nr:FprA family A-type flavoprotein [Actinomycetota bacterium]
GSFGWSSGACKQMAGRLEEIGFEMPFEPFTQKYAPTTADIDAVRAWAVQFAAAVKRGETA